MPNRTRDVDIFVGRMYDPEGREYACRAQTPEEFAAWRPAALEAYKELLGLPRIEGAAKEHVPVVWLDERTTECDGYTRRNGWIETEPGVKVRFRLLAPDGDGPFPVAVTPHGHESSDAYVGMWSTEAERKRIQSEDRDVAVQAARRGFLTIAPATRSIGQNAGSFVIRDSAGRHDGRDCVCHNWQVLAVGRTALGERVWDMKRILDWVLDRSDVDPSRVLMVGNSGGGMATAHTAACEERITVAVPCCAYNNYISFSGTIRHCPCNAVPGMMSFGEFWDVAGLRAPLPLLTVNGSEDALHPIEEVDAAAERLARIYEAAGAAGNYEHRYGSGGHRFYADLMWPWILERLGRG